MLYSFDKTVYDDVVSSYLLIKHNLLDRIYLLYDMYDLSWSWNMLIAMTALRKALHAVFPINPGLTDLMSQKKMIFLKGGRNMVEFND